jgi:hypothetical protein
MITLRLRMRACCECDAARGRINHLQKFCVQIFPKDERGFTAIERDFVKRHCPRVDAHDS